MLRAWACCHSSGEIVGGNVHAWAIHAVLAGSGSFCTFCLPDAHTPSSIPFRYSGSPHSLLILTKYTWVLQYDTTQSGLSIRFPISTLLLGESSVTGPVLLASGADTRSTVQVRTWTPDGQSQLHPLFCSYFMLTGDSQTSWCVPITGPIDLAWPPSHWSSHYTPVPDTCCQHHLRNDVSSKQRKHFQVWIKRWDRC